MKLLAKGFVFRVIYTILGSLLSLIIAKLSGTGEFGVLSLMIVNAAFIQIVTGLGTDSAIVWHGITGKPEDRNKIFSLTLYSALLQLLLFLIAAIIFLQFVGKTILSGTGKPGFFYVELIYFTGLILTEKYSSLFYSQQKGALCNKILAAVTMLLFFIFLFFIFFYKDLIIPYPAFVFAGFIFIPAIVLIIFYHARFRPGLSRPDKAGIISFASFSFVVLITNLIQFVAYRADYWFIDYYHGKADVGIYAQATKFLQLLWILPTILAGLIVPALKNQERTMSVPQLVSISRILFFSHIIFGILLALGSYLLYEYFLPGDFSQGFQALLLLMPGYLLFIFSTILAAYFSANRVLKVNLVGSAICCAMILILDFLLIPCFSYNGAAIASSISYAITTVFFMVMMGRKSGVSIKDFLGLRKSDLKSYNFKSTDGEENSRKNIF